MLNREKDSQIRKSYKMDPLDALPFFLGLTHIAKYMLNFIVLTKKIQSLTYAPSSPQTMLIISSDTGVTHVAVQ